MDWNNFKIRCSSLHVLFTEPQSKAAKEAGELSETAKTHLYDIYLEAKYGITYDFMTKEMKKGILVEDKVIEILGELDGKKYKKNTERKSNEWIQGEADIVDDHIDDAKAPWDMSTLLPQLMAPLPKMNFYQSQGYLSLWNKDLGKVSRVLVDCPAELYLEEQKKVYFKTGVIWEEDPVYLAELEKLKRQLIVEDYIPLQERVIRKDVHRDEGVISKIPEKVTAARKYLAYIESVHMNGRPDNIIQAAPVTLELPPITADQIILTKKIKK